MAGWCLEEEESLERRRWIHVYMLYCPVHVPRLDLAERLSISLSFWLPSVSESASSWPPTALLLLVSSARSSLAIPHQLT